MGYTVDMVYTVDMGLRGTRGAGGKGACHPTHDSDRPPKPPEASLGYRQPARLLGRGELEKQELLAPGSSVLTDAYN